MGRVYQCEGHFIISSIYVFLFPLKAKKKSNNEKITQSTVITLSSSYFGVFGKPVRNYTVIAIS